MTRVTHIKSALKDNPVCKKGESYYWWKFRFGGKMYSLTYPKASQLTQSEFWGRIYTFQEELQATSVSDFESSGDIEIYRDERVGELEELRDETDEKYNNMPEGLNESPTAYLLQERAEGIDDMISELEDVDCGFGEPPEEPEQGKMDDEAFEEAKDGHEIDVDEYMTGMERAIEEIQGIEYQGG